VNGGPEAILEDASHAGKTNPAESERRRIYLWLDGNAPFYGTYPTEVQKAQQRGDAVKEPIRQ
jgi:hypothetical protein